MLICCSVQMAWIFRPFCFILFWLINIFHFNSLDLHALQKYCFLLHFLIVASIATHLKSSDQLFYPPFLESLLWSICFGFLLCVCCIFCLSFRSRFHLINLFVILVRENLKMNGKCQICIVQLSFQFLPVTIDHVTGHCSRVIFEFGSSFLQQISTVIRLQASCSISILKNQLDYVVFV